MKNRRNYVYNDLNKKRNQECKSEEIAGRKKLVAKLTHHILNARASPHASPQRGPDFLARLHPPRMKGHPPHPRGREALTSIVYLSQFARCFLCFRHICLICGCLRVFAFRARSAACLHPRVADSSPGRTPLPWKKLPFRGAFG